MCGEYAIHTSLVCLDLSSTMKAYPRQVTGVYYYVDHSRGDRDNQEGCNEKDKHLSGSTIHVMQSNNHDNFQSSQ